MKPKTFLFLLFLILPNFFIGQMLEEINIKPKDLVDPDQYPFGVYLKVGLPAGAFAVETGKNSIRQNFQEQGINLPNLRSSNIFAVGIRYKRFYLEIGATNQLNSFPTSSSNSSRVVFKGFTINANNTAGWGNVGVSLFQNRNSAFLLRLGLGRNESSYLISSNRNLTELNFDDLLGESGSSSSRLIIHENTFWDIGVEFLRGRAKSPNNFGEIIRLGFRRGINEVAWREFNTSSVNAPLDRMSEIYMQLCFHLGYNFAAKSK